VRTTIHVALRPNTSLSPTWLVVETEDGRQRIEVNEPGRERIAARIGDIDLTRKIMADEDGGWLRERPTA
jgi:hypothetical protein